MTQSASAPSILDREILAIRAKLVDLAAMLDRVDRAGQSSDPRLEPIRRSLERIGQPAPNRADAVLMNFSLPYDPQWRQEPPQPH